MFGEFTGNCTYKKQAKLNAPKNEMEREKQISEAHQLEKMKMREEEAEDNSLNVEDGDLMSR